MPMFPVLLAASQQHSFFNKPFHVYESGSDMGKTVCIVFNPAATH